MQGVRKDSAFEHEVRKLEASFYSDILDYESLV
jgi:hypothetical protein